MTSSHLLGCGRNCGTRRRDLAELTLLSFLCPRLPSLGIFFSRCPLQSLGASLVQLMLKISYLFSAFQNILPLLFLYCLTATCCLGLNITSLNNHGEFRIFLLGLMTFSMVSVN